jgi:hypothetical protein
MPLIEEIEENEAGPSRSGPSFGIVVRELAAKLALPEELLTSYIGGDMGAYLGESQSLSVQLEKRWQSTDHMLQLYWNRSN